MHVYGKNVANEVIEKETIKRAYIYKKFKEQDIIDKIREKHIPIKFVDKEILNRIERGNHQGIILEIEDYNYSSLDEIEKENVIIMLDHLEDPHNFGAIIRTVEAAGYKSIIIPKDRSVEVNSTVIKTSVGTIENVKIAKVNNLVNTIKELNTLTDLYPKKAKEEDTNLEDREAEKIANAILELRGKNGA